jgi:hypothetical protein
MPVMKEAVIGLIVTKRVCELGNKTIVSITPATLSEDPLDVCEVELLDGEELVSVIPAPAESYRVLSVPDVGPCSFLGYEFKGAESPVGIED